MRRSSSSSKGSQTGVAKGDRRGRPWETRVEQRWEIDTGANVKVEEDGEDDNESGGIIFKQRSVYFYV